MVTNWKYFIIVVVVPLSLYSMLIISF